jgi:hypothetical protein
MGFVQFSLKDDAGDEKEYGDYKIWVQIRNKWNLGERGAETLLFCFLRALLDHDPRLLVFIAGAKVSIDAQAVVYLDASIVDFLHDRHVRLMAAAMRTWAGATQARVGFSDVSYSPTLAVLEQWAAEDTGEALGDDFIAMPTLMESSSS